VKRNKGAPGIDGMSVDRAAIYTLTESAKLTNVGA
jgi:hypothetical protein